MWPIYYLDWVRVVYRLTQNWPDTYLTRAARLLLLAELQLNDSNSVYIEDIHWIKNSAQILEIAMQGDNPL